MKRLVKPTPVRNIAPNPVSSTITKIKPTPTTNSSLPRYGLSKLPQVKAPAGSRTTYLDKRIPISNRPSNSPAVKLPPTNTKAQTNTKVQTSSTVSADLQNLDLDSLVSNVVEIRNLLEKLLITLQCPQESQETLEDENKRLREEIAQLKKALPSSTTRGNEQNTVSNNEASLKKEPEEGEESSEDVTITEVTNQRPSVYYSPMI